MLLDPEELLEIEHQNEYAANNHCVPQIDDEFATNQDTADIQGKGFLKVVTKMKASI